MLKLAATLAVVFCLVPQAQAQGSNAANGGSPSFMIGADPLAREPYPMTARGARISYLLLPGHELEATYADARFSLLLADFHYQETTLRDRIWISPEIYYALGFGVRTVQVNYSVFTTDNGDVQVAERDQAITGNAAFGAEFKLTEWMGIGVDLFAISAPLRWIKHSGGFPNNAEVFEEDPKTGYVSSAFKVSYSFLRTYLAVRF